MIVTVICCLFLQLAFKVAPLEPSLQVSPNETLDDRCSTFAAPSLVVPGFGVFASRRFKSQDFIYVVPAYVVPGQRSPEQDKRLESVALYSHMVQVFGLEAVALGSTMIFNDSPEPNVMYGAIGGGPNEGQPTVLFFRALRDIQPGEELFWDYSQDWFDFRGIARKQFPTKKSRRKNWERDAKTYCSKLVAGTGQHTIERAAARLENYPTALSFLKQILQNVKLPVVDHGWNNVVARADLVENETIEIVPTLVLPAHVLENDLVAPLLFPWAHLTKLQQQSLVELRKKGIAKMLHAKNTDNWQGTSSDIWQEEDVALLPMGAIAMVERVGYESSEANCEVKLSSLQGTIAMTLVATKRVSAGERLRLAFPRAKEEPEELVQHSIEWGQLQQQAPRISPNEPLQECNTFVAPSLVVPGFGAFAARSFRNQDWVYVTPAYILPGQRFPDQDNRLKSVGLYSHMISAFDMDVVALGDSMVVNDSPTPNVQSFLIGAGPQAGHPTILCFRALRDIKPGEELFWDYSQGWFDFRGISRVQAPAKKARRKDWKRDAQKYCSKSVVGTGRATVEAAAARLERDYGPVADALRELKPILPAVDHGWKNVVARVDLVAGEIIETAPTLVLPIHVLEDDLVAPLLFPWAHLTNQHRESLLRLRKEGLAKMLHAENIDDWPKTSSDIWQDDDVALLPLGAIAMVARVGNESRFANCEVKLSSFKHSIVMTLVATEAIDAGERLQLALPRAKEGSQELMQHFIEWGQLLHYG